MLGLRPIRWQRPYALAKGIEGLLHPIAARIEEGEGTRPVAEHGDVRDELAIVPAMQHVARWLEAERARPARAQIQRNLMCGTGRDGRDPASDPGMDQPMHM